MSRVTSISQPARFEKNCYTMSRQQRRAASPAPGTPPAEDAVLAALNGAGKNVTKSKATARTVLTKDNQTSRKRTPSPPSNPNAAPEEQPAPNPGEKKTSTKKDPKKKRTKQDPKEETAEQTSARALAMLTSNPKPTVYPRPAPSSLSTEADDAALPISGASAAARLGQGAEQDSPSEADSRQEGHSDADEGGHLVSDSETSITIITSESESGDDDVGLQSSSDDDGDPRPKPGRGQKRSHRRVESDKAPMKRRKSTADMAFDMAKSYVSTSIAIMLTFPRIPS